MWHMQDSQVIRLSQHGFIKCRFCLTNLILFYNNVPCLVDEVVYVVHFNIIKAFDTISQSILLEKLSSCGLDGDTLLFIKLGRMVEPKKWW